MVTVTGKIKNYISAWVKVKVTGVPTEDTPSPQPSNSPAPSQAPAPQPSVAPTPVTMTNGSVQLAITEAKSSDSEIATVDANGKVTAGTKAGTVIITGKDASGKEVSYTINVTQADVNVIRDQNTIGVESVLFDQEAYTVDKGKTLPITVTVTPNNATDKSVKYSTSDEKIATITDAGIIFGVKAGKAVITATASNGKTASAEVTVVEPLVIELSNTELTVGRNQTIKIAANIAGVEWSSDNTAIATVDSNGIITGISAGTANIIATSGKTSASCKVTVTKYDPTNDGVTLSVFNPIKNNDDTIIDDTVLINQDMIIQAYVQKDASPKKNARVKLQLDAVDSYLVNAKDFCIKVNGVITDTAVTNDEGIAEFTVSITKDIESTYDEEKKCPYISFNASTLVDNQPNSKDIIVKFASVLRSGIVIDNNDPEKEYEPILPFVDHADGDDGIEHTHNTNNYFPVEYVSSQQVGNDVYMSATPYFILPPDRKTSEAKFRVEFPSKKVTTGQSDVVVEGPGQTESYSIYNDGTDETTTTSIINVPGGLVSMSVFFNKISISKYSKLCIDLYEYDAVKSTRSLIYSDTYDDFEKEYEKEDGVSIQNLRNMKKPGILIISIQSPGQVDTSKTGYVLNSVVGDFNSDLNEKCDRIEIVDSVKWTEVTKYARYTVATKMSYDEVSTYLKEYVGKENTYIVDDSNYKFEYRLPTFNSDADHANSITGNALITATYKAANGEEKTATYAYPSISVEDKDGNATNMNGLLPKTDKTKAIFLGYDVIDKDGNIQQTTKGIKQEGNQAIISSANISGAIFVEAKMNINALQQEIKKAEKINNYEKHPLHGANSKFPLYSYVQFVAETETEEPDGVTPVYHAVEDQYIVVTGEVKASNDEVQTTQPVKFIWNGKEITPEDVKKNLAIGNGVVIKHVDEKTNKDGKAYLVLCGHEGSYVEDLSFVYDGAFKEKNLYVGNQKVEPIKQNKEEKRICTLCWLDLGLTYQKDATKSDEWMLSYGDTAGKTDSTSEVNKEWKVGFLPAVKCPMGDFVTDYKTLTYAKHTAETENEIVPNKLLLDVSGIDVNYRFDGINYEQCNTVSDARIVKGVYGERIETKADTAIITSSEIGETTVVGNVKLSNDNDSIHVIYYDSLGIMQEFDTVGVTKIDLLNQFTYPEQLNFGGEIDYTMTWTPGNWESEFVYPYGKKVHVGQDTNVYFHLRDKDNNPIKQKEVVVTAYVNNTKRDDLSMTLKTNDKGLVVIPVSSKGINANDQLSFTANVEKVLEKTSEPIQYIGVECEPIKVNEYNFDTQNKKKITLKYNTRLQDIDGELLKNLFVVRDKKGNALAIDSITVNLSTVNITLSEAEFIDKEEYTIEMVTEHSKNPCIKDGITYVLYDENGQAVLDENAVVQITVKRD